MKKILALIFCMLLLAAGTALADGQGEWLYSRLNGWVQLAAYTGDYDGYVGTSHYSEFAKTGYRPYLNGSNIQKVYKTWSEAVTAGLLELIERRKNDI